MKFVEDVFLVFADAVDFGQIHVQGQDLSAIRSFQNSIFNQKHLTEQQSKYILKLLQKYKTISSIAGIDLQSVLDEPAWKNPFRVLDTSKKIYIEENSLGNIEIFVKFPYFLKEVFETEFPNSKSIWDPVNLVRKIDLKNINIIALHEFASRHHIDISEDFQKLHDDIEEIWNQEENFTPHSKILNGTVVLKNCTDSAEVYFNQHKTQNIEQDLFLAKSMGFCLKTEEKNIGIVEKIASSTDNYFRTENILNIFELYKKLNRPRIVLIIDRTSDISEFVENFVDNADIAEIDRSDIKVCFRMSAEEDKSKKFNSWIKENNLTGPVLDGKIFIFSHKPAKWLFTDSYDTKIIVTNSLFTSTNSISSSWMNSHHCVIFVGEITPTVKHRMAKGKNVVEL